MGSLDYLSLLVSFCEWFNHFDRGPTAERLLSMAIRLLENAKIEKTEEFVVLLSDLGHSLTNQGKWEEALLVFQQACETENQLEGEHSHGKVVRLLNLGAAQHKTKDLIAAEKTLRLAVERGESAHGLSPHILGAALNDLAGLLFCLAYPSDMERIPEVIKYQRRALEIDQAYYGIYSPLVALDLENLGVYLSISPHGAEEAEECFKNAIRIQERSLPQGHPQLLHTYKEYALHLERLGRVDDARQLRQQADASEAVHQETATRG